MDREASWKLLDAYYEAGGNFIDTAVCRARGKVGQQANKFWQNNYQDEQSEQWLGEWMKEKGNRDMLVIATKYNLSSTSL